MFKKFRERIRSRIPTSSKRIYIVPTETGAYFGVVTFAMLLVGSGYNNNLVNLLAFFMFALVFVSMVVTQAQMQSLDIQEPRAQDGFVGRDLEVSVWVHTTSTLKKFGMEFQWSGQSRAQSRARDKQRGVWDPGSGITTVAAAPGSRVRWVIQAQARGRFLLQRLEVSSIYPLGLFYTWKILAVPLEVWVYPAPIGELPFQPRVTTASETLEKMRDLSGSEDYRGHRKFEASDSPRRVDWKAYARTESLLVKEFQESERPELLLSWDLLPREWEVEKKLSQMSKWLEEAVAQDQGFEWRLPGKRSRSGRGIEFATLCWRELALFEEKTS